MSITTLALPMVGALRLSSHQVGAIWIALGAYQLAVALCRGFIALPDQVAIARQPRPTKAPRLRRVALLPVALGALTASVALFVPDDDVRRCLLVLAPTLPILLMGDCVRHWAYALNRVDLPARASTMWAVLYVPTTAGALVAGATPARFMAAWALPGVVSGVWLIRALGIFTDSSVTPAMGLSQRLFLASDAVAGSLAGFAVPALAGVVATLSEVGVLQNSRMLFRPVNVLLNVLLVAGIPMVERADEGAARLQRTRGVAVKTVIAASAITVAGLLGYLAASWTSVELSWTAIVLAAIESIAVGPYIAFSLLATTMMRTGTLLAIRVCAVVVQVAGVLVLADSGVGGLAAASLAGVLLPAVVVPWWATRAVHSDPVIRPLAPSEPDR